MSEVISSMTGPEFIGFVGMIGGLICTTVIVVAVILIPFTAAARRTEAVCQLKRDLVAAGFSADDIERLVRATPGQPAARS